VKQKLLLLSWLGALLFLAGVLVGLSLSAAVTWGESEARIYSSFNGDASLRLKCRLMISPDESGVVRAEIINTIDKDIKPVVTAEISHGKVPREISQRGLANAQIRQMDAEHLDFPESSFEVVLCGFALFFFPQLDRALAEFGRVLKLVQISNQLMA